MQHFSFAPGPSVWRVCPARSHIGWSIVIASAESDCSRSRNLRATQHTSQLLVLSAFTPELRAGVTAMEAGWLSEAHSDVIS